MTKQEDVRFPSGYTAQYLRKKAKAARKAAGGDTPSLAADLNVIAAQEFGREITWEHAVSILAGQPSNNFRIPISTEPDWGAIPFAVLTPKDNLAAIIGQSGVGKTVLLMRFAVHAAMAGEHITVWGYEDEFFPSDLPRTKAALRHHLPAHIWDHLFDQYAVQIEFRPHHEMRDWLTRPRKCRRVHFVTQDVMQRPEEMARNGLGCLVKTEPVVMDAQCLMDLRDLLEWRLDEPKRFGMPGWWGDHMAGLALGQPLSIDTIQMLEFDVMQPTGMRGGFEILPRSAIGGKYSPGTMLGQFPIPEGAGDYLSLPDAFDDG